MKKIMTLLVAVIMAIGTASFAVGCGSTADFTVGIIQLVQHESLDKTNTGFKTELTKLLNAEGKTVKYVYKNASNDVSNCGTIASTLVSRNPNLVLAIATPAAQAMKNAIEDTSIPMLFSAITDAVDAGLVDSNAQPGGNVTGVSDINPVAKQIKLAHMLAKGNNKAGIDKNKIGFLYCTNEANSLYQLRLAQAAALLDGCTIEAIGIPSNAEITATMQTFATRNIGALYIPTDNTIISSQDTILSVNEAENGTRFPIVCGEADSTSKFGVATYGVDYLTLGQLTAQLAFDILINGKHPRDIAVADMSDIAPFSFYEANASRIGYTIPQEVKDLVA